jgi:gas vesicle protein
MADEQNQRLKNGTFGVLAGGAVGALASLITNEDSLVIHGVFGAAAGAAIGWLVYLLLAFIASREWGQRLVEYHVHGLRGVREKLVADERALLVRALGSWGSNFTRVVMLQRTYVVERFPSESGQQQGHDLDAVQESPNPLIRMLIQSWLTYAVDTFNLVLDALDAQDKYRSRASVIVFGSDDDGNPAGAHWCSYSGRLSPHRDQFFREKSFAYLVSCGKEVSPFYTSAKAANQKGEKRSGSTYYSFILFKLTDNAVLTVDWPGRLKKNDPQVRIVRDLFYLDINPAIQNLLQAWRGDLAEEVGLAPLEKSRPAVTEPS